MEKLIIVIEKSSDYVGAYAENCDGIYGAGATIDDAKKDVLDAINIIKNEYPANQWPEILHSSYEIEWKLNIQSFLKYYKTFISLAGLEKITGLNREQLLSYINSDSSPKKEQRERINHKIHQFAHELLNISF